MNEIAMQRKLLRKIAQVVLKMDDLNKFLNSVSEMIMEAFGASWAALSVLDETTGRYALRASSQRQGKRKQNSKFNRIDASASRIRDRQRVVSCRLLEEFGQLMTAELKEQLKQIDTAVSLPLFVEDQCIGVLNLGPKTNNKPFNKQELDVLGEIAELIAAITNQTVNYRNLNAQKLHQQNILDNLVSGIIAIDLEGKITVFNRTAEKILNIKPEEALGHDARILQANLVNLLLETLHNNKSYCREELYILPENTLIGVSTSQFFDDKDNLLGACMVFSNLAAVKKKQELARRKNLSAYWSNVANSLAHEIKNSIMATKTFGELLPEKHEDAQFRSSLHATLKRDMEKLDSFSENLLDFAKSQELIMQPCRINQLIDAAIASVLQDQDAGKITFEKKYDQNLKPLPGDYHQLKRAFTSIISNALEAMEKRGKLTIGIKWCQPGRMSAEGLPQIIRAYPQGNAVVVKIQDTGCGISAEDLPYLFDPFFTTKAGRAGLGLSTARKILERHGGVIAAESRPDEGSAFWICLPVLSEAKKKVGKI